ncbi:SGNH/GDSL hydrolase family protein [Nocardioides antri]|uniref:SGNH/GDSL hydrolase family protein n=1 Tax=Nocardioides antri TaxID=2607659 RepID=A0A5B1MBG0_9ACTN|nr:SGNH/GDSL hydrolase family protein [Nocardioides antri]KAA1429010.1 SGNH/GDSL hydrolase family protein [Nocardioides antri]
MRRLAGFALALVVSSWSLPPGPADGSSVAGAGAPAETGQRYREYVALGDSWTAGIQTSTPPSTTGRTPRGCQQSGANYPRQVADALGVTRFRDASCVGASTRHLRRPQWVDGERNPPQLDRLRRTTDLVTLGIGVNNSRLFAAIGRCMTRFALGSCRSNYVRAGVDEMSEAIAATLPRLAAAIDGIRARAPRARVLVVNYLNGLPADGSSCSGISRSDMRWFQARFLQLNGMLARAARRKGVELVDTYRLSLGRDMCQAPTVRFVDGLVPLSSGGVGQRFHPNQRGADAQARIVLRAVRR